MVVHLLGGSQRVAIRRYPKPLDAGSIGGAAVKERPVARSSVGARASGTGVHASAGTAEPGLLQRGGVRPSSFLAWAATRRSISFLWKIGDAFVGQ